MRIEETVRVNFCQFTRSLIFGLHASPNPRQRLSPLESAMNLRATDTVSEIVSKNSGGVMENSGELSPNSH
jgi:hypothetical protein